MSRSPHELIRHILDEIEYLQTQTAAMDYDAFLKDSTAKRAIVRSLEIIGEASKKLPEDVKSLQPDIEWRKVTGMRDRLIHDYFGVDYAIVWDAITTRIPDLHSKMLALLEAVGKPLSGN